MASKEPTIDDIIANPSDYCESDVVEEFNALPILAKVERAQNLLAILKSEAQETGLDEVDNEEEQESEEAAQVVITKVPEKGESSKVVYDSSTGALGSYKRKAVPIRNPASKCTITQKRPRIDNLAASNDPHVTITEEPVTETHLEYLKVPGFVRARLKQVFDSKEYWFSVRICDVPGKYTPHKVCRRNDFVTYAVPYRAKKGQEKYPQKLKLQEKLWVTSPMVLSHAIDDWKIPNDIKEVLTQGKNKEAKKQAFNELSMAMKFLKSDEDVIIPFIEYGREGVDDHMHILIGRDSHLRNSQAYKKTNNMKFIARTTEQLSMEDFTIVANYYLGIPYHRFNGCNSSLTLEMLVSVQRFYGKKWLSDPAYRKEVEKNDVRDPHRPDDELSDDEDEDDDFIDVSLCDKQDVPDANDEDDIPDYLK